MQPLPGLRHERDAHGQDLALGFFRQAKSEQVFAQEDILIDLDVPEIGSLLNELGPPGTEKFARLRKGEPRETIFEGKLPVRTGGDGCHHD